MDASLHTVAEVGITAGVACLMIADGTAVPLGDVLQAIRAWRVVAVALLANFVVMPLAALGLVQLLPMPPHAQIALMLLGVCAGLPMLVRLSGESHGNKPFAVGLLILLMIGTVIYVPLALPLLLPGVTISSRDIASSLNTVMLAPLVVGLVARSRYPWLSDFSRNLTSIGRATLAVGIGAGAIASREDLVGILGANMVTAAVLLGLIGLLIGWFLASNSPPGDRQVVALGTAVRNVPAALLIASRDFGPDIFVMTTAGALALRLVLLFVADEMGRRLAAGNQG